MNLKLRHRLVLTLGLSLFCSTIQAASCVELIQLFDQYMNLYPHFNKNGVKISTAVLRSDLATLHAEHFVQYANLLAEAKAPALYEPGKFDTHNGGSRLYIWVSEPLRNDVIEKIKNHGSYKYKGVSRTTVDLPQYQAVTMDPSLSLIENLKVESWRSTYFELKEEWSGVIGDTQPVKGNEMGLAMKPDGTLTLFRGSYSNAGSHEYDDEFGHLFLHTHSIKVSRWLSPGDVGFFQGIYDNLTAAAKKVIALGKTVHLIAKISEKEELKPGNWFKKLDVYFYSPTIAKDTLIANDHALFRPIMNAIKDRGLDVADPKFIIVNPTKVDTTYFDDDYY